MNIIKIKYGKSVKLDKAWKNFEAEAIVDQNLDDMNECLKSLKEFVEYGLSFNEKE